MTRYITTEDKKKSQSGSILIFALVAVSVATLLSVGLSFWLRPQIAIANENAEYRRNLEKCYEIIDEYVKNVINTDTNEVDNLEEDWCKVYSSESDSQNITAIICGEWPENDDCQSEIIGLKNNDHNPFRSSYPQDEEGRYPLNMELKGPLAELIFIITEEDHGKCEDIAGEIYAMRPIVRREQIQAAPSMTPEIYRAIAPYVTAAPIETININTASDVVLKALFSVAQKYDSTASLTLSAKILAFRTDGGYFEKADAAAINLALGGLNQAELMLISMSREKISTTSRYISAVAISGSCKVYFTYDRKDKMFLRITNSR